PSRCPRPPDSGRHERDHAPDHRARPARGVTATNGGPEIRFERRGGLMVVTLNRPRALNALSLAMCQTLDAGLIAWKADPQVQAVLIKGTGERAFCAGGDIRSLYDLLTNKGIRAAEEFY